MRFCKFNGSHVVFSPDKDFLSLQRRWYKALKKTGFEDIEKWDITPEYIDTPNLKQDLNLSRFPATTDNEIDLLTQKTSPDNNATMDYYSLACEYLDDLDNFRTVIDRNIWKLHSEGHTVREIAKIRRKAGVKLKSSSGIWERVAEMRHNMFLKFLGTNPHPSKAKRKPYRERKFYRDRQYHKRLYAAESKRLYAAERLKKRKPNEQ